MRHLRDSRIGSRVDATSALSLDERVARTSRVANDRAMPIIVVLLLVGCVPAGAQRAAQTALGSGPKHTRLMDSDTIGGDEVYVFCRDERERDAGSPLPWNRSRSYDGACVTVICTSGHCHV